MPFLMIRLILLLGVLFVLAYFLVVILVPENSIFIQERLGRYYRTLLPGFYFQIPLIDKIAYRFTKQEQTLAIKNLKCQTSDAIDIVIDAIFIFQIQDPIKAAYETDNYLQRILREVQTNILTEIQNHYSEELFGRRYGMNQSIVKHTGETAKHWGIKIIRFEIQQIKRDVKIT